MEGQSISSDQVQLLTNYSAGSESCWLSGVASAPLAHVHVRAPVNHPTHHLEKANESQVATCRTWDSKHPKVINYCLARIRSWLMLHSVLQEDTTTTAPNSKPASRHRDIPRLANCAQSTLAALKAVQLRVQSKDLYRPPQHGFLRLHE